MTAGSTLLRRLASSALCVAMVAACTSGRSVESAPSTTGCEPKALDDAAGTTEVSLWSYVDPRDRSSFERLIGDFNETHPNVRVSLVDKTQPGPEGGLFTTAPADRPDVAMVFGGHVQPAIDQHLLVPAQSCLDAQHATLAEVLPGAAASAAVDGVQWGVPFGASGQVLVYDRGAFRRAGLNPDRPLLTLDDLEAASEQLVNSGATKVGLTLPDPVPLFLAAGVTLDQQDSDASAAVARWLRDVGRNGIVQSPAHPGRAPLLELDGSRAGMTIVSSTDLADVVPAIHGGQAPGVDLAVAPLPTPSGTPAVPYRSDALYLLADRAPEKTAAAWAFLRWFTEPAQQARFAADAAFLPVDPRASELEPLVSRWRALPELAAAANALRSATPIAEPLTAPYHYLAGDLYNAGNNALSGRSEPSEAMADAAARAAVDIAGYQHDPARYARCLDSPEQCALDSRLVVMNADGTAEIAITDASLRARNSSWSPDGQHIAFESDESNDGTGEIHVVDPSGGNGQRLTDNHDVDAQPDWSPDSSRLVFWSTRTGNGDIYSMAADGSDVRRLTIDDDNVERNPTYSPDGTRIVFVRATMDNQHVDIWVMDAAGGNERQLTTTEGVSVFPAWSPDGTHIVFTSTRGDTRALYVMNPDGSDQHPIVPNGFYEDPDWSFDGRHLAFIQQGPSVIIVADGDGSNPHRVSRTLANYDTPSWSPDGQHLVAGWHGWPGQTS